MYVMGIYVGIPIKEWPTKPYFTSDYSVNTTAMINIKMENLYYLIW